MKRQTTLVSALVLLGRARGASSAKLNRRRDDYDGRISRGVETGRGTPSHSRGHDARADGLAAGGGVTPAADNDGNDEGKRKRRRLLRGSHAADDRTDRTAKSAAAQPDGGADHDQARPTGRGLMKAVSQSYLATHPWYPAHSSLSCSDDGNMPEWMTWTGGYAENHLFATGGDCCRRWFAGDGGHCLERVNFLQLLAVREKGGGDGDGMESYIAENLPSGNLSEATDNPHKVENGEAEGMVASILGGHGKASGGDDGWDGEGDQSNLSSLGVTYHDGVVGDYSHSDVGAPDYFDPYDLEVDRGEYAQSQSAAGEDTFPTSSCGSTWSHAATCTVLCLDGRGCPSGQACHVGVPCPSSQVALAMGSAGSAIMNHIDADGEFAGMTVEAKVCGTDYQDAESKCRSGDPDVLDGLGYSDDFAGCPDDVCPDGMVCYGGILCPLPPTISPAPTRSPIRGYEKGGGGRDVVAYYDGREWYGRDRLGQPGNLRWDMVTRVNYFFFRADGDGDVWGGDSWADPQILFGTPVDPPPGSKDCSPTSRPAGCRCHRTSASGRACGFHDPTGSLLDLAAGAGVDVYATVGGTVGLPRAASTRDGREGLARSLAGLVLEYGFDGIDLAWVHPGREDRAVPYPDASNLVMLLRTVKAALDSLGQQTGRDVGLTVTLPCDASGLSGLTDPESVAATVDGLNLVTHGFGRPGDGPNAGLPDVERCVDLWSGSGGEGRSKINVMIPFYGQAYSAATSPGPDVENWPNSGGRPRHYEVAEALRGRGGTGKGMTSRRDVTSGTRIASFDDGSGSVSYDDRRSVCDKVGLVVDGGLGGVSIWDISGDIEDDLVAPLLEAVNRKLALPDIDCGDEFGVPDDVPPVSVGGLVLGSGPGPAVVDARPIPADDGGGSVGGNDAPVMVAFDQKVPEPPSDRADKAEVLGVPVFIDEPAPAPVSRPVTVPHDDSKSPYTLDVSSFGGIAVAATSCDGGCPPASTCVGNSAGGQAIADADCAACNTGQTWWPCDVQGLCWCWKDGTDRIAPAPQSGLQVLVDDRHYTVCDDILSRGMFDRIAPEAREPYTYEGLCDAILSYNAHHSERAFGMGTVFERTAELAAFLGNTLHESDEFRAGREYLMCADNKVVGGETYCKPCDPGSFDWGTRKCGHSLVSGTSDFNEYCQPSSKPPEACRCGDGAGQTGGLEGYVPAQALYFGRGAIQLSWNYNYIGASVALTGSADTFCDQPDLVATEGRYAWGAGLYFWMEHVKEGTTSHMQALRMDFGGTLNNINGGLECPAHGGWHVDAVKARLNRYCRASSALGLPSLMTLDGCAGLEEALHTCLPEGKCPECQEYAGKFDGAVASNFVPAKVVGGTTTIIVEETSVAEEPLCPDGLMPWDKNESCCVPNPNFIGDGACDPSSPYNTAVCGYDGGDCCKETCDENSAFGCNLKQGDDLARFGPFGFYCVDPSQGYDTINSLLCDVDDKFRIGDGRCDAQFNVAACNYDGGDCCVDSCDADHTYFECGVGLMPHECLDPRFAIDPTKRPTNGPTNKPTPYPTDAPSPSPTPDPTKMPTSPPTSEMPTSDIAQLGSEDPKTNVDAGGSLIGQICPLDMMECPDGSFVGRNPKNDCMYDACPSGMQQQTVLAKCEGTLMECPGTGTFVSQDPANNCAFYPCPESPDFGGLGSPSTSSKLDLATSISFALHDKTTYMETADEVSSSPTPSPVRKINCRQDMMECKVGSFVSRNPDDKCNFYPCPKPLSLGSIPKEDEDSIQSLAASVDSSFTNIESTTSNVGDIQQSSVASSIEAAMKHHKTESKKPSLAESINLSVNLPAGTQRCPSDLMECSDGSFVGQDVDNGCEWFPCPPPPSSMSAQAATQTNGRIDCLADLLECPNGRFVGQDPDNNCEYFPCDPIPVSAEPQPNMGQTITMPSQLSCTTDLKECPDGKFVGQDPNNSCAFFPCNGAGGDPSSMSAMSQHVKSEPKRDYNIAHYHKKKGRDDYI